jgi:Ni,Fe-hydrogenase III large subunit
MSVEVALGAVNRAVQRIEPEREQIRELTVLAKTRARIDGAAEGVAMQRASEDMLAIAISKRDTDVETSCRLEGSSLSGSVP